MNRFQRYKAKHMKNLKFIDEYEGKKQTRKGKLFNSELANILAEDEMELKGLKIKNINGIVKSSRNCLKLRKVRCKNEM